MIWKRNKDVLRRRFKFVRIGIRVLGLGMIAANFMFPMTAMGEEKETLTYESPVFLDDGSRFIPEEMKIQEGKEYRLVSKRIRNAKKEGTLTYAQVTITYDLEGDETVPETAHVPLIDEASGIEFERELPVTDMEEVSKTWSDTLSFPVTVYGYGADVFSLGDQEIPGNADLSDYGDQLLELAGLSSDYYRVERVTWEGEPYQDGNLMCRNARAEGSRLLRSVKARYGGQVRTPDLDGKQYIGIYEEVAAETEKETEAEETLETASAQTVSSIVQKKEKNHHRNKMFDSFVTWLKSHVTVVALSIGILFLTAGGISLFLLTGKKNHQ